MDIKRSGSAPSARGSADYFTGSVRIDSPGREITIRKTYDGTGGVSHSVIYQGTVSSDLRTISGQWTINTTGGNFIIWR